MSRRSAAARRNRVTLTFEFAGRRRKNRLHASRPRDLIAMRFCRACLAALLLAFGLALACTSAHAAAIDDALAKFTTDDFDGTNDGIGAVAASGSPQAEAIIRALQDGHLMFSAERKAVYLQDDDGKLTDPATGH